MEWNINDLATRRSVIRSALAASLGGGFLLLTGCPAPKPNTPAGSGSPSPSPSSSTAAGTTGSTTGTTTASATTGTTTAGTTGTTTGATTPSPSATASSGTTSPSPSATASASGNTGDSGIVNFAIGLENEAIFAYQYATGQLAFSAGTKALAGLFASQHGQHQGALGSVVKALGAQVVATPAPNDIITSLGTKFKTAYGREVDLKNEVDVVKLAILLEAQAIFAYQTALKTLSTDLAKSVLTIMPDEAAHLATLRAALLRTTGKDWVTSLANAVPVSFPSESAQASLIALPA